MKRESIMYLSPPRIIALLNVTYFIFIPLYQTLMKVTSCSFGGTLHHWWSTRPHGNYGFILLVVLVLPDFTLNQTNVHLSRSFSQLLLPHTLSRFDIKTGHPDTYHRWRVLLAAALSNSETGTNGMTTQWSLASLYLLFLLLFKC